MAKTKSIKAPSSFGSVTNTTDETTLGSVSLPAYSVKTDYKVRCFAVCETTSTNSTDTFALKLKLGSTALSTVTAFDAADGDVCFITFEGLIDVSAETLNGVALDGRTGQALANPEPVADLAFDTDAAQTISVTGTWSVASASNNAVLKAFTVELEPVDA
jgi:hypothetical protein